MIGTSTTSKFRRRKRFTTTRDPTPEQRLYEIRDIQAEKWERDRLFYLIDWADDNSTGEKYDPTWEPAENATEAAVADWEAAKSRLRAAQRHSQRSSAESSSESDSQPVLSSNWRKRRRRSTTLGNNQDRLSKRPKTTNHTGGSFLGDLAEEDWSLAGPLPDNRGDIVLDIRVDPGFDPHEYIAISLSQSSQASQASQVSQDCSFPASASKTGEPEARTKSGISQITIPDLQETTDLSQDPADPLLSEASSILQTEEITGSEQPPAGDSYPVLQAEPVSAEASDLDIPSGQPGTSLPRPFQYSISPFEEQDDISPGPATKGFKSVGPNISSQGFLTQPGLNLLHPSIQRSTSPEVDTSAICTVSAHDDCSINKPDIVTPRNQSSHSLPIALTFNSQPAQIVLPLTSSYSRQILTQVQDQDIFQSIESDVIPDTVLKPALKGLAPRRAKSESEILFSTNISVGEAASPSIGRPGTAMDPFTGDDSELSTADQLRAFRDSILGAPFYSSSHPPTDLIPAAAQPHEQSLISPSSVLPGTDNDGPGGSSKAPVAFSNVWHVAPAGISLRTLDMAFGAKPAETTSSEHVSLSVAKELGHDMNMQFPLENPVPSMLMPPSHFSAGHEHQPEFEQIPATVAPSDLTNAPAHLFSLTADPLHSRDNHILGEDAGDHVEILLSGPESDPYHLDSHSEHQHEDRPQGEFTVTLPMAANTRQLYLEQISGDNKRTMLDFATGFAKSLSWVPDDGLLAKMDRIFEHLLDLCDLPTWAHDMTGTLTPEAMWKHATGSNSKFSFVYEFLNAIKDLNARVLILSHSGYAFQYLESLLSGPGFNYSILGGESIGEGVDGLTVILASADQQPPVVHGKVDIVINFDHVARAIDLSQVLPGALEPLVLSLVVTNSIEHIDLQLGPEPRDLERKNAINLAIGSAKELLKSPERGFDPHDIAEIFAGFVRNPDHGFVWEPSTLPEHVLDLWLSSQAATQDQSLNDHGISDSLNNRKHRLDDDEIGTPKRARILDLPQLTRNRTPAQMSDLLKETLIKFSAAGSLPVQSVELPVHQLESMAAKIAELESRLASQNTIEGQYQDLIKNLESQVQSWETSVRRIQPKYMEAIHDRSMFEKETIAIKKKLEERDRQIATLKDQKQALKVKLETPELDRLATAEIELAEAQAKLRSVEKKAIITERDMEYSRGAYQTASTEASKLVIEKRDLISKMTELEKRASENFRKVHEINNRNADEQYFRQLEEKNEIIRERERDLERAREELRHYKNGRRETRQASVPRSPRPGAGVMSPRPPRVIGGQGPGSRPASPPAGANSETGGAGTPNAAANMAAATGPGMTFLTQPPGNARWGHLRD